jgi:hypothetical protein
MVAVHRLTVLLVLVRGLHRSMASFTGLKALPQNTREANGAHHQIPVVLDPRRSKSPLVLVHGSREPLLLKFLEIRVFVCMAGLARVGNGRVLYGILG